MLPKVGTTPVVGAQCLFGQSLSTEIQECRELVFRSVVTSPLAASTLDAFMCLFGNTDIATFFVCGVQGVFPIRL